MPPYVLLKSASIYSLTLVLFSHATGRVKLLIKKRVLPVFWYPYPFTLAKPFLREGFSISLLVFLK